jgi:hypothetical protein
MKQEPRDALRHSKFAICIANEGCDDLQIWKLYQILDDPTAFCESYLRVIDESGEDYLYPESQFVVVAFPETVEQKLLAVGSATL